MKSTSIRHQDSQTAHVNWSNDLLVYQPSATTESQNKDDIPRFGDDRWALHGFQWKPTATATTLSFRQYPNLWKNAAKRIAWCMLNLVTPVNKLHRPNAARPRLSKGTAIANMISEIKPFIYWLDDQGTRCLPKLQ